MNLRPLLVHRRNDSMPSVKPQYKHSDVTDRIIGVFYDVYNVLGYGFLEKMYERAMVMRLEKAGLSVRPQEQIDVYFDGELIGHYLADLVVNDVVLVELKAADRLAPEHEAQLLNYLRATDIEVGLLLNFGNEAKVVRRAFDNHRKRSLRGKQ
jgi:GxxExxY protein